MPAETGSSLPSQEELEKLPPRAIVAYAVRCARRVQPLCVQLRPDDDEREGQLLDLLERALQTATEFARGVEVSRDSIRHAAIATATEVTRTAYAAAATADAARAAYAAYGSDVGAYAAAEAAAAAARATTAAAHSTTLVD